MKRDRIRALLLTALVAGVLLAMFAGTGQAAADSGDRAAVPVPKLILDGDVGPDPCDFSTLAMAHNLDRSGEIDLLGVMSTMPEASNVEVIDIFNRWYGDRIPIGTFKDPSDRGYAQTVQPASDLANTMFPASRTIAAEYSGWHPETAATAADSVTLYRRLLSAEPDRSVTIMTQGQLYNIKALLSSGPDEYSPLDGMDLVRAKVSRFVMMIGAFGGPMTIDVAARLEADYDRPPNSFFPQALSQRATTGNGIGAEYNAQAWYPGLTQSVFQKLDELPTPKILLGNEQGFQVPTGDAYNKFSVDHPVRMGYYVNNLANAVGSKVAYNNPAYDEIALLYVARGAGGFLQENAGHARFSHFGTSTWADTPASGHIRLTLRPGANDDHELSDLIEGLVLGPESTWHGPAA
ncbi:hypothetical protein [Tomitella fengzijianii]|uniref:Inosine-uridine preferring nucleoside hydrolase n=1 Tax=Tomitella fengzijianii TaxID=2597660 RepID=A0A516X0T2_9ACTN|nr:hypothetical protein [Tomitella fengzijianii]QDQ96699.1 hypothetical protein FO059_04240 [Tomitella fengzijianii]